MNTAAKPQRRWLASALAAATSDETLLPWAEKRIQRPAPAAPGQVIRIFPSAPTPYVAIAAR